MLLILIKFKKCFKYGVCVLKFEFVYILLCVVKIVVDLFFSNLIGFVLVYLNVILVFVIWLK